jgi:hypothetical protein
MHYNASIVIPVWNRLEVLGNCLASLAEHTPDTQFILVDLGSERETERRLEQFAEALEERVLLMHEPLNQGKMAAINRGIASAAADIIVVLSPMSIVSANWLSPLSQILRESPDVGIVCPDFSPWTTSKRRKVAPAAAIEISRASFYCQALPRQLIEQIGTFDNSLDGGAWCLADFSRRAWQSGYKTVQTVLSQVYTTPEQRYGSLERRAQTEADSSRVYSERWGENGAYCLWLADVTPFWSDICTGARQGDQYTIMTPTASYQRCKEAGLTSQHASISFVALPRLFPERRGKKLLDEIITVQPDIRIITDGSPIPLPGGVTTQPMFELTNSINERDCTYYRCKPTKD